MHSVLLESLESLESLELCELRELWEFNLRKEGLKSKDPKQEMF